MLTDQRHRLTELQRPQRDETEVVVDHGHVEALATGADVDAYPHGPHCPGPVGQRDGRSPSNAMAPAPASDAP